MEPETNNQKIVTVTLNPSLDKTLITSHLHIGYHNHVAGTTHLDASGRGMNVSRALDRLEQSTLAVVLLGNDAIRRAYQGLISEEMFPYRVVRHQGPTRSDTIVVDTGKGTETHIIDEGATCGPEDFQNVLTALIDVLNPGDKAVLAGTLPHDAAPDLYARMTETTHNAGAEVIVLANGDPLRVTLAAKPEMVMLTRLEAEALFNYPVRNYADMFSSCNKLIEQGAGKVLMVSEDHTGAILVSENGAWIADIDGVEATGTDSGVVDAMLAGYLSTIERGDSDQDALAFGAASLIFAASQIGNEFGTQGEINPHLHKISVRFAEGTGELTSSGSSGTQ